MENINASTHNKNQPETEEIYYKRMNLDSYTDYYKDGQKNNNMFGKN